MNLHSSWSDTIIALATPPGVGAIGVIRLSGARTFSIVNQLFPSRDLEIQPSHTLQVGYLRKDGQVLDEVVLSLFRGPKSYTGEDVIEISCHGSPYVQQQVIAACTELGARLAYPGEFTQRAFLNGKMDLAQAEAVADLIAADSEAARQTALKQLRGGFSQDLSKLREQLIHFAALIELELDFSQEDVEFADRTQLSTLIDELSTATARLAQSFKLGNVIRNGVNVAIVGKPNAGKSTLLNALLNEERAIVSEIAGTTRDTIEETLNISGILFRFQDTAGIREHTLDKIEQIGIRKAYEKIETASVLLFLTDVREADAGEVKQRVRELTEGRTVKPVLVFTKADLLSEDELIQWRNIQAGLQEEWPVLLLAAKPGVSGVADTIDDLREVLYKIVAGEGVDTEHTIVTNARHHAALLQVQECLREVREGLDNNIAGDFLALDIRRCLHYLGEITGQVEVDRDILGTIFGKFCIGK
ncbi:tRNA uridine-5-carboxymethylaminomethyl(34) synthesis GTPase MnmE [Nostoc ellipsosporum NOK]|nr:tRNA uridine-5-carboxymethylaminomethyl(34) synthesis GTPase MnmE [Nostoc ellipsosporum NOK]